MFNRHVSNRLSAYCHRELPPEESRRVSEHLMNCERCRAECDDIKLGIQFARQLPPAAAPEGMWGEIEALLDRQAEGARPDRPSFAGPLSGYLSAFARSRAALATTILIVGLASAAAWYYFRATASSWEVVSLAGQPVIESNPIRETGSLGVGDWLETDGSSRAQISVSNIGQVEVEPNTRIRLVETRLTEHRLELERGTMHAMIYAPPRLFFVDTPSATAIDYGCAYTLAVDDTGASFLHVTMGLVAMESKGRESMVPAGAACETRPGVEPGTPYFEDASDALKAALSRLDFEGGGAEALRVVLSESRRFDTLTLWHLLARVGEQERGEVYDRMIALSPAPDTVTREGIIRLDKNMLDQWRDDMELYWFREDVPVWKKAWRGVWEK
ncbi:MAG TPA: zf-HC2 domain-containing protein [Blastocatellia bacterium]|nr:zf-HC2 domain-containing protein [Blastocatellia bacterium]